MNEMIAETKTLMTAEEFLEWVGRPENENGFFELVRGEVIEVSRPTRPHCRVSFTVGFLLETFVRDRDFGYVCSNDTGVILERDPDTVRGPDIALYEDATSFDEIHPKYGEVPPILAVEVLSPNDRPNKVMAKVTDYLRAGVKLVWVIDPEDRTVAVYAPDRVARFVGRDGELTGDDALPGLSLRVAEFFFVPGAKPKPAGGATEVEAAQ